eukprot:COSAG01_NODE_49549_length_371_cov_0.757353_1_plen_47_part_01
MVAGHFTRCHLPNICVRYPARFNIAGIISKANGTELSSSAKPLWPGQ